MIKRESEKTLKAVIEELLYAYGWKDHIDGVKLLEGWEKVVGRIIAKHTSDLVIRKGVLYVTLDSSVIRSELHQERTKVVKDLNKKLGRVLIKEMILF